MKLISYLITTEGILESCEAEHALSDWRNRSGSSWINIEALDPKRRDCQRPAVSAIEPPSPASLHVLVAS